MRVRRRGRIENLPDLEWKIDKEYLPMRKEPRIGEVVKLKRNQKDNGHSIGIFKH